MKTVKLNQVTNFSSHYTDTNTHRNYFTPRELELQRKMIEEIFADILTPKIKVVIAKTDKGSRAFVFHSDNVEWSTTNGSRTSLIVVKDETVQKGAKTRSFRWGLVLSVATYKVESMETALSRAKDFNSNEV